MRAYILRRLLLLVPIVWGTATIVFAFIHLIPGDPVQMMIGDRAAPEQYEQLRAELKLDEPLLTQYGLYMKGLLTGDWGKSIQQDRPVLTIIYETLPYTLVLAVVAMIFTLLIAVPLGVIASLRPGTWIDNLTMTIALLGICLPTFWAGPLFQNIFSVQLNLLPVSGADRATSIILPSLTLGAALSGMTARILRSKMLDIQSQEYVKAARAKGLSESMVIAKHILRNALIPLVTIVGLQFGALLAGAVVTEMIFNWPGIGAELVRGIQNRDFPVVQGLVLWIAFSYVIINLLTDLLVAWISPQVRLS